MRLEEAVQCLISLVVGSLMLDDTMGEMAPFLKHAIMPSVPSKSSGLMLKFPTRDSDIFRLKPRRKHLKTHKLMKRLGSSFDKNYMSIVMPEVGSTEMLAHQPDEHLQSAVREVNISLTYTNGNQVILDTATTQALQTWLVNRASCPVVFRWEDLGVFFWPRWIKKGYCVGKPSCSWPPGMHCITAELKRLTVLWWHCRRPWRLGKGRGRRPKKTEKSKDDSNDTESWKKPRRGRRGKLSKRCKWEKVPYPITNRCYCSC